MNCCLKDCYCDLPEGHRGKCKADYGRLTYKEQYGDRK